MMKQIIVFFRCLYIIIGILLLLITIDIIEEFYLREKMIMLICKDTTGNCHWNIIEFYTLFHWIGSILFMVFGQSKIAFLVGQIFTLLIYWGIISIIEKILKFITSDVRNN